MLRALLGPQSRQLFCRSLNIDALSSLRPISLIFPTTFTQQRNYATPFWNRPSDILWEGVTGPTGSSKKRARGKRRVTRPKIDLNKGQRIGYGESAMKWPGLTTPIINERQMVKLHQGELDEERQKNILIERTKRAMKHRLKYMPPLERGWSGSRMGGRSVGPPETKLDYDFPGFTTCVLELKMVTTMTGARGRFGRYSCLVVTGNGQGLAGYAVAKSPIAWKAMASAKKKAATQLEYFHIRDGRTLWHKAFVREWNSKIFAYPYPLGKGLNCHRCIKTICEVVGIKDMFAKVEKSTTNYQKITSGFFKLLREQETYQDLADKENLHVVEYREERDSFPRILASPSTQESTRSIKPEEDLDMDRYYFDGRVAYLPPTYRPKFWNHPGVVKKQRERFRYRNLEVVERRRKIYQIVEQMKSPVTSAPEDSEETVAIQDSSQ